LRSDDHKLLVDVLGMSGRVQRNLAEAQRREGGTIESLPSRKVHDCEVHAASVSRLGPATSYGAEELFQVLGEAHRWGPTIANWPVRTSSRPPSRALSEARLGNSVSFRSCAVG